MSNIEFVDPATDLPLSGTHAFGTVDAGSVSAAWPIRIRYLWGQSGSGLDPFALILKVLDPAVPGVWRTDLREFTVEVTGVLNPGNDPLFLGAVQGPRRVGRLDLPPLRAGCAYDLLLRFAPTLRPGAAKTAYSWDLGLAYNESWTVAAFTPDGPSGVLTGLGQPDVSEWVTFADLTPGTDLVSVAAGDAVIRGLRVLTAAGDVALNQNDGASEALATGQEYLALITVAADGSFTVTKGLRAAAGTAALPAYPVGELAHSVVRVPYGGVIVTTTPLGADGRLLVSAATGLDVLVAPGRAQMLGSYAHPRAVQLVTVTDDATTTVSLRPDGVAAAGWEPGWIVLAAVDAAGGIVTEIHDRRTLVIPPPFRLQVPGAEAAGTAKTAAFLPTGWTVDRVEARLRVPSAGATGSTDIDVQLDGSSIATASIAAQASSAAGVVTVPSGAAGWLTVDVAAVTAGGTPASDLEVLAWIVPLPA